MSIIVTRGLPGSGKSTWATHWVADDPENRVRVNRDDIRLMLFGRVTGVDEALVTKVEEQAVRDALATGKEVVVDACHLKSAYVRKWLRFGEVTTIEFEMPVEAAVQSDKDRYARGGRTVGEDVIRGMAKRYHIPEDGTLPKVDLSGAPTAFEFKKAPPYKRGKKYAIIVDVDGTLAKMNGKRGPYDTHLYHLDDVEHSLRRVVKQLSGQFQVLITSGRSEDFRTDTLDWLKKHGIFHNALIMRKSGDLRNDSIVKHDLFHEHIAPRYNVVMAFDDRNRVVDMWREIGITTAQMDYGDF